jgi:hypothetical protein
MNVLVVYVYYGAPKGTTISIIASTDNSPIH